MGLFDFLKPKPKDTTFISEQKFQRILQEQIQMLPVLMEQLRNGGVTADIELRLEYFFYTNTAAKAEQLANEMEKLNYNVEYGTSADDESSFLVTGWTTKMKMEDDIVKQWTRQMGELGYKFDCEFDGWGTKLQQD